MATMSLDALRVFQAVAQAQSFTKAGERLGQDKSQVSRTVRELEVALKTVLLARTTRSVRLTAEGEQLFRRVSPLLVGLDEALAAVPDQVAIPSGEVVITTTPDIGRALLAPALVGFRARFPAVTVQVVLANEVVDLMTEGVDLALRVGRPGGETLVAKKLGELTAGFFATPAYLERRGVPVTLDQLERHDGLWPAAPKGQKSFSPGPTGAKPAVQCADFGLLMEVARAGGGVALLPTFLAARDVSSGSLVRVLPEVTLGAAPIYLVSRPLRPVPPRIAALRAHLIECIRF